MQEFIFEPVARPDKKNLVALRNGLKAFNEAIVGEYAEREIAAFAKNKNGKVIGGIYGKLTAGWLYIDWLWVQNTFRHKGIGTKLLQQMENYAVSQNIMHAHLETTNFQALDFYKKNGYEIFGTLKDKPPGCTSYFLQKKLR